MTALHEIMETLTRAIYAPHGESYLALPEGAKAAQTDIKLKGVLLLHPPLVKESFVDHMKHGIHRLPVITGLKGMGKILPSLLRSSLLKEVVMADSLERGFWYVGFLAVDPDCQGQGVGSVLLQSVVDKADKEDLPVYLETGNPRNVPWYEKFGFATVYTEKAGFMGPTVFYMRREVQSMDKQTKEQLLAKAKQRVADSNESLKRGLLAVGIGFVVLVLLLFYVYR